MRIKCLIAILLAISICPAKQSQSFLDMIKDSKTGAGYYLWPIFYGGGTFFFSGLGVDDHWPGYALSGGLTFSIYDKDLSFFADALYSYRNYDGYPQPSHYHIEETTAAIAAGIGLGTLYLGGYMQFPLYTIGRVKEWTIEDFDGMSRTPSFSLMCGMRITRKHLGLDLRLLLGQGPGQFLKDSLGDHWLGQISLGVMGGF
jgi:hypothetical protein